MTSACSAEWCTDIHTYAAIDPGSASVICSTSSRRVRLCQDDDGGCCCRPLAVLLARQWLVSVGSVLLCAPHSLRSRACVLVSSVWVQRQQPCPTARANAAGSTFQGRKSYKQQSATATWRYGSHCPPQSSSITSRPTFGIMQSACRRCASSIFCACGEGFQASVFARTLRPPTKHAGLRVVQVCAGVQRLSLPCDTHHVVRAALYCPPALCMRPASCCSDRPPVHVANVDCYLQAHAVLQHRQLLYRQSRAGAAS
jgi:hypothetical protein